MWVERRVNGLAISRSIGDKSVKEKGEGQVIAIPEYSQLQLTEDNHFMILASDGLWDKISNEQAIDLVKKEHKEGTSLNSICQLYVIKLLKAVVKII